MIAGGTDEDMDNPTHAFSYVATYIDIVKIEMKYILIIYFCYREVAKNW